MSKPNVERLRELIDQARRAHDEPTVKALGEKLFEATGVYEPEFAPVEPSGDPKLDHLKACLVQSIAARDTITEATLRGLIKDIEGEPLPEVNVELTEEPEDVIENPFAEREDEEVVDEAEIAPLVVEDYETRQPVFEKDLGPFDDSPDIREAFKGKLQATQIAALRKVGINTEQDIRSYVGYSDQDAKLIEIKGISDKSATAIMETLGYEA